MMNLRSLCQKERTNSVSPLADSVLRNGIVSPDLMILRTIALARQEGEPRRLQEEQVLGTAIAGVFTKNVTSDDLSSTGHQLGVFTRHVVQAYR
jgi:hypothetical protein